MSVASHTQEDSSAFALRRFDHVIQELQTEGSRTLDSQQLTELLITFYCSFVVKVHSALAVLSHGQGRSDHPAGTKGNLPPPSEAALLFKKSISPSTVNTPPAPMEMAPDTAPRGHRHKTEQARISINGTATAPCALTATLSGEQFRHGRTTVSVSPYIHIVFPSLSHEIVRKHHLRATPTAEAAPTASRRPSYSALFTPCPRRSLPCLSVRSVLTTTMRAQEGPYLQSKRRCCSHSRLHRPTSAHPSRPLKWHLTYRRQKTSAKQSNHGDPCRKEGQRLGHPLQSSAESDFMTGPHGHDRLTYTSSFLSFRVRLSDRNVQGLY